MNRIAQAFAGKTTFIPFITAGDPDLETTGILLRTLAESGADLIEIGIPFSDPIAEGPVIEAADVRALAAGFTTEKLFDLLSRVRPKLDVPVLLMTYYNPVFVIGVEKFCARCAQVGVDGLIIPDLPFEERGELVDVARACGVTLISMIAPTSTPERIEHIARNSEGFLYCVSSLGVTGERSMLGTAARTMIETAKKVADIPCAVGFGVSVPEQARDIAAFADGVIVGSAIVGIVAKRGRDSADEVARFTREMKDATATL
jgi:tryptophan synthase alpha chain